MFSGKALARRNYCKSFSLHFFLKIYIYKGFINMRPLFIIEDE